MSNQNRFLLPHAPSTTPLSNASGGNTTTGASTATTTNNSNDQENQHSVDTDFDCYWEEEARNPHRNRIRIGRQYQATVPPLLKLGECDQRRLPDLETLTFCPRRSAKVSNAELDHYFTVAKSLNLFASLVETRSLLGRDVTIADLNHIRNKEGLSLASVIQPSRQATNYSHSPQSSQLHLTSAAAAANTASLAKSSSPIKSPPSTSQSSVHDIKTSSSAIISPLDETPFQQQQTNIEATTPVLNQPLMKALSHFISLHHPCHHDQDCKKLNKNFPLEDDSMPAVSITAGNLRQVSSASNSPAKGRSRSSLKQQQQAAAAASKIGEETTEHSGQGQSDQDQANSDKATASDFYDDWTREDVELFSKAIEICGKNFGSIKKEFLPTKSVRSIVEYYYIGSRDASDSKRRLNQNVETGDSCNCAEKSQINSNDGGGGSDGAGDTNGPSSSSMSGKGSYSSSSGRQTNNPEYETRPPNRSLSDGDELISTNQKTANHSSAKAKVETVYRSSSDDNAPSKSTNPSKSKTVPKGIDARMSVYNFDDDFKDESPIKLECPPRSGAEVRPLKAKPIIPNASLDNEAGNSNVGSLKFFMDGQLVLKLNACQDQQEGADKCHWVQSGEKLANQNRQKRYSKRASNDNRAEQSLNGSHSNSVVSSNLDEDSKNEDLTLDEDSKESANSFSNAATPTPQKPKSRQATPKRSKTTDTSTANSNQAVSPINYNRMAINNRMKDSVLNQSPIASGPLINQAAAAAAAAANMPNWLQANQFAMAAAILGGLPFPTAAAAGNMMQSINSINNNGANHMQQPASNNNNNNNIAVNMATSKPMDLSLEHSPPKPISTKSPSRSRSKQKN